ncbi:MAG: TetR/AcrR family transcriptional regulator [Lachnospiraceae bacterium]|nr:TetR/AcrR family transcriptional regulator [Lachnospiraceae bacterium]
MSVPDRSIDPRLLSAAKEEFLKNGYEASSLNGICKAAGVTTGALYKRYKGKEDLFSALVSDTIRDMEEYVSAIGETDLAKISDQELHDSIGMSVEAVEHWLRFLYERKDGFTLLVKCSSGTRYENFHHDWAQVMNKLEFKYYQEAKKRGLTTREVSIEEINVLTYAVWALFVEPFILGFTWDQMVEHAEVLNDFLDWHKALGIVKPATKE